MLLLLLLLLVLLVLLQLLLLLLLVLLVLMLVLVVLLVVLLLVLGEPQGLFGKLTAGLRGSHQKETPARGKCGNTAQKKILPGIYHFYRKVWRKSNLQINY